MTKKLFIFDNSKAPHQTSIYGISKIFQKNGYEVIFCLGKYPLQKIGNPEEEVIYISSLSGIIRFFKKYKKADILIFNTVSFRTVFFNFFITLFTKNNIFYVRNANSWFALPTHAKRVHHKIIGKLITLTKRYLLKHKSVGLISGSFNIKNYLKKQGVNLPTYVIPFNFFSKQRVDLNKVNKDKPFLFVIPGTIDFKRKDLSVIRDATYLFSKDERENFKVILLGYPVDDYSLNFVNEWKSEIGDSLQFWPGFVPNEDFANVLEKGNVIMGSLNVQYEDRFYKEVYGQTKDTGIEAHAIAYAKPLIVNFEYKADDKIKTSTLTYKDKNECYQHMKLLVENNERYLELRENAYKNSHNYSLDIVAKYIKESL